MNARYRNQLIADHLRSWRKIAQLAVPWADAIAGAQGVHPTDLIAASYLHDAGATTAGQLAEAVGLSTGAMTASIDRLERAGLAKREADANDRRKVIVKPGKLPKLTKEISTVKTRSLERARRVLDQYSDDEIGRMTACMLAIAEVFAQEARDFRATHRQVFERKR